MYLMHKYPCFLLMFILAFKMKESIENLLDPSGLNPSLSPKMDI